MVKIYELVVESVREPRQRLRFEIEGQATLDDLHDTIAREFGLDSVVEYSFHRSGIPLDPDSEYTSADIDAAFDTAETLDHLALRAGVVMAHVHDEEEMRWNEVRVVDARSGAPIPGLVRFHEHAASFAQADEVLEELVSDLRATLPEDPADPILFEPEELAEHVELALRVVEAIASGSVKLARLQQMTLRELEFWLEILPQEIARHESFGAAAEFTRLLGTVHDPLIMTAKRAEFLVRAGDVQPGLALMEEALARYPKHPYLAMAAAEVHALAHDPARAEQMSLRAIELAGGDDHALETALRAREELLLQHLDRPVEAEQIRTRLENEFGGEAMAWEGTLELPEAGRNDPCPCGSGKKFKKCCGKEGKIPRKTEAEEEIELMTEIARHTGTVFSAEFEMAAVREFCGDEFEGFLVEDAMRLLEPDGITVALSAWLLLDKELDSGGTAIRNFLAKRRSKLLDRQISILERVADAQLGLYRVASISRDGSASILDLVDLLDDSNPSRSTLRAVDCDRPSDVRRGDTILARAALLDERLHLLSDRFTLQAPIAGRTVARMRDALANWSVGRPDASVAGFRKHLGRLFGRAYREELFLDLQRPDRDQDPDLRWNPA